MTTTVTAAVARTTGEPLTTEHLQLDGPRSNEVRVRMVATGICHTDAIVRDGIYPTPLPAVLGHEGAGVVEAIGEEITTVDVGDHVVLPAAYCGHCRQCRSGRMAYCKNLFEDFGGHRHDGTVGGRRTNLLSLLRAAGSTFINSHAFESLDLRMPFGGVKQSGIGRAYGEAGMSEYVEDHAIRVVK